MKVRVNYDRCEGYARCMLVAPAVFDASEFEQARVLIENPTPDLEEEVRLAVRVCPRQAIEIQDDGVPADG